MYNWDSSWNWSTKSLSSPASRFYFLNSFISSFMLPCACSYLFEDFDWRLSQFPQINFFSLSVFFLVLSRVYALCTMCLSSFHHDDYTCVLLCLLLSTYSAASSSSFRNFPHQQIPQWRIHKNHLFTPPLVDITHFQSLPLSNHHQY